MSYEFQSTLHNSSRAMCDAIAYEWATAGGMNDAAVVDNLLTMYSNVTMANECIEGWDLNSDWLAERDTTREDIEAAFARFILARPDREAAR